MNYDDIFTTALQTLHDAGNYRVFAELERRMGQFPKATRYKPDGSPERPIGITLIEGKTAEEMLSAARAQRMADAVSAALARTNVRVLTGIRDNHVIAVVSATRRLSGWTAPQSLLADRLMSPLRLVGPAALIGVSNDVPATSHIPRAAAEARVALDLASVADRVKAYSALSLRQLLVASARDTAGSALPAWMEAFYSADRRARGRPDVAPRPRFCPSKYIRWPTLSIRLGSSWTRILEAAIPTVASDSKASRSVSSQPGDASASP